MLRGIYQSNMGEHIMDNITYKMNGTKLLIEVDLSKKIGPSKSGKSVNIASTGGNVNIGVRNVKMGLNVYEPVTL